MKINKNLVVASALTILLSLPMGALAITFFNQPNIPATWHFTNIVDHILTIVWWTFLGLSVIFFIVIAVLFLSSQGNPEQASLARKALIWGGVGIIIGILAFGIVRIIARTFGLTLTP